MDCGLQGHCTCMYTCHGWYRVCGGSCGCGLSGSSAFESPRGLLRMQRSAPSHLFGIKSREGWGLPALLDYLSGDPLFKLVRYVLSCE